MPLRTFLARAADFMASAWAIPTPDPAPEFTPVPCWSPALGERVWCIAAPAPGYCGFDGPVHVVDVRVPGLEFIVRNDGRDAHEFLAFRGELLPAAPAEDMVEAMRRISAECAH